MDNFQYSEEFIKDAKEFSDSCIDCGVCTKNCEMLRSFNINPKSFFSTEGKKIDTDAVIPYSCSMCGMCSKVCPKGLKLENLFFSMRKEHIRNNKGKSPMKGHNAIEMHQSFGFSKLFTTLVIDTAAGFTKRVFIPGCSLSSYNPELVGKTLKFLQLSLPGTGAVLKCCGQPTLLLGQEDKFHRRYESLQNEIDRLHAEEVITACQNCFTTISKFSPKQKVKSLWTVIKELGLPDELKGKGKDSDITFALHDPCPTRYNSDIQEAVRWIIEELGYKVKETVFSRENTRCCGFGGMTVPANPELTKKIMKKNAHEIEEDYVITYCASCREAMTIGGKKALHILDLMFNDVYYRTSRIPGLKRNFLENWTTRYKSKKVIKNCKRYK